MRRSARAGSTRLHVLSVDLEAGSDDDAVGDGEDVVEPFRADAGVREDVHIRSCIFRGLQIAHREGNARGRTRDENRIHTEIGRAPGAIGDASPAEGAAEFRRDVVEECDIIRADGRAVAGKVAERWRDDAKVALVHAGQHLANERCAGCPRDREARLRVPEDVHPEGNMHRC